MREISFKDDMAKVLINEMKVPFNSGKVGESFLINSAQLMLRDKCAHIPEEELLGYKGRFSITSHNVVYPSNYMYFKGTGKIELTSTNKYLHFIKINNTGLAINRKYYYASIGDIKISKFSVADKGIGNLDGYAKKLDDLRFLLTSNNTQNKSQENLKRFTTVIQKNSEILNSEFVAVYGSGIVVVKLPFPSSFLREEYCKDDTLCIKLDNIVLFQNTLNVVMLNNSPKRICNIFGYGILWYENVLNGLQENIYSSKTQMTNEY